MASTRTYLDITEYRLRFRRPLAPWEATQLRGFFGRYCSEEPLLHHHLADGRLLYDYPRVQFKVLDEVAQVIGIADGGALIERLWREVDRAFLGREEMPILEALLLRRREALGEAEQPLQYRFRTPWLALNQENHRRYESCSSPEEQRALLERILIGNTLALARSFGHDVTVRLVAAAELQPQRVRFKGVPLTGFRGTFALNFWLPPHLGIGKSVARGFGTVELWGSREEAPC